MNEYVVRFKTATAGDDITIPGVTEIRETGAEFVVFKGAQDIELARFPVGIILWVKIKSQVDNERQSRS